MFVPINVGKTHWTLLIVLMKLKTIRYYDSLCKQTKAGDNFSIAMLRYLNDMCKVHGRDKFDFTEWVFVRSSKDNTPQQSNGVDCGVFTALFASCLTDDVDIKSYFENVDIRTYRMHMYNAINAGTLL
jgi:sentrin-specific protease 1